MSLPRCVAAAVLGVSITAGNVSTTAGNVSTAAGNVSTAAGTMLRAAANGPDNAPPSDNAPPGIAPGDAAPAARASLHPVLNQFADSAVDELELRHAVQNLIQELLHSDRLASAALPATQPVRAANMNRAERRAIAEMLVQLLIQRLQRLPNPESKIWVTHALGKLGRYSEPAVATLTNGLNTETSPLELRLVTLDALVAIARETPAAAAAVSEFAARIDAEETRRQTDVQATDAQSTDVQPTDVQPTVTDVRARHVQHELFLAALRAVGELGPSTASSLPVLMRALDHPASVVRLTAAESIGVMGTIADQSASRLAEVAFGDENADVRSAAEHALSQIGPVGLEQIRPMLHAESIEYRRTAWEIVATARTEFVNQTFHRAIADASNKTEDDEIRASAATAAAKHPSLRPLGLNAAVELLESSQRGVRQRAEAVLSKTMPIPLPIYNRVKSLTVNRNAAVRTAAQRIVARWPPLQVSDL